MIPIIFFLLIGILLAVYLLGRGPTAKILQSEYSVEKTHYSISTASTWNQQHAAGVQETYNACVVPNLKNPTTGYLEFKVNYFTFGHTWIQSFTFGDVREGEVVTPTLWLSVNRADFRVNQVTLLYSLILAAPEDLKLVLQTTAVVAVTLLGLVILALVYALDHPTEKDDFYYKWARTSALFNVFIYIIVLFASLLLVQNYAAVALVFVLLALASFFWTLELYYIWRMDLEPFAFTVFFDLIILIGFVLYLQFASAHYTFDVLRANEAFCLLGIIAFTAIRSLVFFVEVRKLRPSPPGQQNEELAGNDMLP